MEKVEIAPGFPELQQTSNFWDLITQYYGSPVQIVGPVRGEIPPITATVSEVDWKEKLSLGNFSKGFWVILAITLFFLFREK